MPLVKLALPGGAKPESRYQPCTCSVLPAEIVPKEATIDWKGQLYVPLHRPFVPPGEAGKLPARWNCARQRKPNEVLTGVPSRPFFVQIRMPGLPAPPGPGSP
jgi:hypothetical protein